MNVQVGNEFDLWDCQDRLLGQVHVESREGDLVCGRFVAGPAFSAVKGFFQAFEEAVNAQALSVVDQLDEELTRLDLRLRELSGGCEVRIHDVQVWSDGDTSLRLAPSVPVNGTLGQGRATHPARS